MTDKPQELSDALLDAWIGDTATWGGTIPNERIIALIDALRATRQELMKKYEAVMALEPAASNFDTALSFLRRHEKRIAELERDNERLEKERDKFKAAGEELIDKLFNVNQQLATCQKVEGNLYAQRERLEQERSAAVNTIRDMQGSLSNAEQQAKLDRERIAELKKLIGDVPHLRGESQWENWEEAASAALAEKKVTK